MKKLRIFCWFPDRSEPFVFNLPHLDKIGHPIFAETIFDLIEGCEQIDIVPHSAITIDLTDTEL
ncbi:MAG: hypothetical protein ACOC1X_00050 [Promethearchaeota archaeon]